MRNRGFTLVEILIVVAIIVLLMSVLLVSFSGVFRQSSEARTKATIETLRSNIESYKARWGIAPPGNMLDLGMLMAGSPLTAPNRTNEGIECLVLALRSRKEGGPYLDSNLLANDELRTNIDGDMLHASILAEGSLDLGEDVSAELFEIVDAWGNPLIYINITELRRGDIQQQYTLASGEVITLNPSLAMEALRNPDTGQYPADYLIWSLGPDGVNQYGLGDDITSWPKFD